MYQSKHTHSYASTIFSARTSSEKQNLTNRTSRRNIKSPDTLYKSFNTSENFYQNTSNKIYDTLSFRNTIFQWRIKSKKRINNYYHNFHHNVLLNKMTVITDPQLQHSDRSSTKHHRYLSSNWFLTNTDEVTTMSSNRKSYSNTNNINDNLSILNKNKSQTISFPNNPFNIVHNDKEDAKKITGQFFDTANQFSFSLFNPNALRKEELSNFSNKNQMAMRIQYNQEVLLKTFKEKIEQNETNLQETNSIIYQLNKGKNLLFWYSNYLHFYVKHLYEIVASLKNDLQSLWKYKNYLKITTISASAQAAKKEKWLCLYKQIKVLLLCVKFKRSSVYDIPEKEWIKYGWITRPFDIRKKDDSLNSLPKVVNTTRKLSRKVTDTIWLRRLTKRGNQIKNDPTETKTKTTKLHEIEENPNQDIFESPDEFIEYYKDLENDTFQYFEQFNLISYKNKQINEELVKNEWLDFDTEAINTQNMIDQREEDWQALKCKHEILMQEYQIKIEIKKNNNFRNKIFNKIKEFLLMLPLNIEIEFKCVNFYKLINTKSDIIFYEGVKESKILYSLKILEKVLTLSKGLIDGYKAKNAENYYISKVNWARKKRIEKNQYLQDQERNRRNLVNLSVIQKYNKILFKPIKKVAVDQYNVLNKQKENEKERRRQEQIKNALNDEDINNWLD